MKKKDKMFTGEMIEIPADFLFVERDNTFSWRDRSVYLFILAFKKVMGRDPSRSDFITYVGMSLPTVKMVLNKFKSLGLMEVKHRRNKGGTGFKANEHTLKAW